MLIQIPDWVIDVSMVGLGIWGFFMAINLGFYILAVMAGE